MEYIIRNRAHRRNRYFRLLGRKKRFQNQINFPAHPEATICSTAFYGRQRASHCQKRVLASFTAKMIRGSTTSIKDKVLPFFVSCLLWLCWHTLFRHREGTSACCSCFSLCDRPTLAVALRSADRAFSPTRYGSFHSVPFGQRASHCIRECWRYSANMILSQDTFSESVSAFNVSCPLFRLLAHTLIAPRGSICLLLLFPSM